MAGIKYLFLISSELAREIERARLEAGLSVEEMLMTLRDQRKRYVAEKYGQIEE